MQNGLQRKPIRILLTFLTAAMMILIFCFSMEPAEKSDKTSGTLSQAVISIMYPDYDHFPSQKQHSVFDRVQHFVRKTAHFTEYTLLGFLIRMCLESWIGNRRGNYMISWGIGTLYAVTDEIHQLLIDGRSGQWSDVLIDSGGVAAGAAIAAMILCFYYKRKQAGGKKNE